MKKNGFTLVELLVSISLVSIVLIVMLNSLVKLKAVYDRVDDETDIRVTGSIIAREIGYDILKNEGIKSYSNVDSKEERVIEGKTVTNSTLDFDLNSGAKRQLVVTTVATTTKLTNIHENKDYYKKTTVSTVAYSDPLEETNKLKLLKTVSSEETYTLNGDRQESSDIKYYHYLGISINELEYTSVNHAGKKEYIYTITIPASAKEYDVKIYSAKTGI